MGAWSATDKLKFCWFENGNWKLLQQSSRWYTCRERKWTSNKTYMYFSALHTISFLQFHWIDFSPTCRTFQPFSLDCELPSRKRYKQNKVQCLKKWFVFVINCEDCGWLSIFYYEKVIFRMSWSEMEPDSIRWQNKFNTNN